jgi:hypothetical protein
MNKETEARIGSTVGEVETVHVYSEGVGCGKFQRVKMTIDINYKATSDRGDVYNGKRQEKLD